MASSVCTPDLIVLGGLMTADSLLLTAIQSLVPEVFAPVVALLTFWCMTRPFAEQIGTGDYLCRMLPLRCAGLFAALNSISSGSAGDIRVGLMLQTIFCISGSAIAKFQVLGIDTSDFVGCCGLLRSVGKGMSKRKKVLYNCPNVA
jgi:hypothetical protein